MQSQAAFDALVTRIRRQGREDAHTEVKSCAGKLAASVWETVSAFANTDGGTLLLGISEAEGFTPVPGFAIEKVSEQFITGMGDGGEQGVLLTNPPRYRMDTHLLDGLPVLSIAIEENDARVKPCYITGRQLASGAFKRVDDHDVRLSSLEVFEMQTAFQPSDADRQLVAECSIDDLDRPLLDELLSTAARDERTLRGTSTLESKLARLNVTDPRGEVRLAGLLTTGTYPQQFFPRLHVDVAVHPTTEKASVTTRVRFLDRVECIGPISAMVVDATRATLRNLRTTSTVQGSVRRDEPEIPEEVLREAIANAVVHREYSAQFVGEPVAVDVYPDRVTVTNPGGLWGGRTRDNLGEGVSVCRNQRLMQLLKHAPALGPGGTVVEGNGSGVPLMIAAMTARDLAGPVYTAEPARVTVTFPRREGIDSANGTTVSTPVEQVVLGSLSSTEAVSVSELSEATGRTANSLRPVLRRLIADGRVIATAPPQSRHRRYLLAK